MPRAICVLIMSGPSIEDGYESYLWRRQQAGHLVLADWEADDVFTKLAMVEYPTEMEACINGRESNRSRMRLRYEGYRLLKNAKQKVEALHEAAAEALKNWGEGDGNINE